MKLATKVCWLLALLGSACFFRPATPYDTNGEEKLYEEDELENDGLLGDDEGIQFDEDITLFRNLGDTTSMGRKGLCVVGCTPYVDLTRQETGLRKYRALVKEMARTCDVIAHIGDTKPGAMPCMRNWMIKSVHILKTIAKKYGKIALYAPGDNELNDCHRHGHEARPENGTVLSEIYKASHAREHLVESLRLNRPTDLTSRYPVQNHEYGGKSVIPGTDRPYSCDFDKYVELDDYAIATLEVIGSHMYLGDERKEGYPNQDKVDPLMDRLFMYLNAMDCALEWIDQSASKASDSGKRALFILFHGIFYGSFGTAHLGSNGIGEFYNNENLQRYTQIFTGEKISYVYQPLFDKLTEVALKHKNLMFYVVHSDAHRIQTIRLNPGKHNTGLTGPRLKSHHNLMAHMVEGASRSLTMYSRFTVDPESFQPVTHKQEWCKQAYDIEPRGHSWIPY